MYSAQYNDDERQALSNEISLLKHRSQILLVHMTQVLCPVSRTGGDSRVTLFTPEPHLSYV